MTRKAKTAASRSHEEATVESFRKDPKFAEKVSIWPSALLTFAVGL